MAVLGLDPGTRAMGYGLIDGDPARMLACGVFRASSQPLPQRLLYLYLKLEALLEEYSPREAAIEEPFVSHTVVANPRSAIAVGQAQAIAFLACARRGIPTTTYPPARIKAVVAGYGASDKAQVQEMVRLQLELKETPPSDAADALAVALCHLAYAPLGRRGRLATKAGE